MQMLTDLEKTILAAVFDGFSNLKLVSSKLNKDQGHLCRCLAQLVADGMLEKTTTPDDFRVKNYLLTEKGEKTLMGG